MMNTELLQEDVSLPAQYWETFSRSGGDLAPEKRLLIAVLEEAIKSYRTLVFSGGRRLAEVEAWIWSDDNRYAFSFRSICDVLGLSATRVRQSLRTWAMTQALRPSEKTRRPARPEPYSRARKAPAAEMRA
jgi:hypothetical protein